MKAIRLILKISAVVFALLGAACLIAGYFDELKALLPAGKQDSEFEDYADVDEA